MKHVAEMTHARSRYAHAKSMHRRYADLWAHVPPVVRQADLERLSHASGPGIHCLAYKIQTEMDSWEEVMDRAWGEYMDIKNSLSEAA